MEHITQGVVRPLHRAGGLIQQPCRNPQHGRLPAPGRTDYRHELALLDLEADVSERLSAIRERLGDLFESKRRVTACIAVALN